MIKQLAAALIACIIAMSAQAADEPRVTTVSGKFADVKDAVVAAIEGKGLLVSYTGHIGAMLERTGKDLGTSRRIYDEAESVEFCSARVSRQMMEINPANIAFCPFVIAVYTLPGEKGKVHLAYRQPPPGVPMVAELLRSIVAEAAAD